MRTRLLAAAFAAAALAACGAGGAGPVPPARNAPHAAGERTTRAAGNLVYNGGPVQTAPHVYVVFWGSAWNTTAGDPSGVAARLKSFYGAIGGNRWLKTLAAYSQSDGQHVGNGGNILFGSYVDTSSAPPKAPTQAQLAAEAAKAAAHFGNLTVNADYVVALPHGIAPAGFGTQYCGYHSTTTVSGHTVPWTNLPYVPDAGSACGLGAVNAPGTLDGVTLIAGNEQADVEIDPESPTGWTTSSGGEVADLCAWSNLENNPNAGGYPTQPLYSLTTGTCVQSS